MNKLTWIAAWMISLVAIVYAFFMFSTIGEEHSAISELQSIVLAGGSSASADFQTVENDPHYAPNYEENNAKLWAAVPAFGEVEAQACFDDKTAAFWNRDFSQLAIVCVLPGGYGIIYSDRGTVVGTDTVSLTTEVELVAFMQALGYSR